MTLTLDLLDQMLTYDPQMRLTAEQALQHKWFQTQPIPLECSELPKLNEECHLSIPANMKKIEEIEKQKLQKIEDEKLNLSEYTKLFIKSQS